MSTALAAGAVGYSPPAVADDDSEEDDGSVLGRRPGSSFNLTPYARPSQVVHRFGLIGGGRRHNGIWSGIW